MTRSRQRYLSIDGPAVRDHWLPMGALASILDGWSAALAAALPGMVTHMGIDDAELARSLGRLRASVAPAEPGSYRQPYALEVRPEQDAGELFQVPANLLDDLVGGFEHGMGELQHGRVIAWMTAGVAKHLLDGLSGLARIGARLELETSRVTLDESTSATLREFVKRDAEGKKAEIQVLGVISSVNMKSSYFILDSPRQPSLRATFSNEDAAELCAAMAHRERVVMNVLAAVSSDGTLVNANLRTLRRMGARPNFREVFRALWGSQRDMYAGIPHDERGVPDPDPETGPSGATG